MIMHYIVTEGEYSDYHIRAVFSDKEKAESYVKIFGGEVEEWEDSVEIPRALWWEARLTKDGNLVTRQLDRAERHQHQCATLFQGKEFWKWYHGDGLPPDEGLMCLGETKEDAIKNVRDAIAKAKAELAGIS